MFREVDIWVGMEVLDLKSGAGWGAISIVGILDVPFRLRKGARRKKRVEISRLKRVGC
jgi:hypothetical protein